MRRTPITKVLVCVLAVGTFVLALEAKRSQYRSDGSISYLSKAVKMSGERPQTAVAPPPAAPVAVVRDISLAWAPRITHPVELPKSPHLSTFRYRPPPSVL